MKLLIIHVYKLMKFLCSSRESKITFLMVTDRPIVHENLNM